MLSACKKIKRFVPEVSVFTKTAQIIVLSVILCTNSHGQSNLSGTWALQSQQKVSGPAYDLTGIITIDQQTDSLGITTYSFNGENKLVTNRQTSAMNGNPVKGTSTASSKKYIKSLEWNADKTELVITTIYYSDNNFREIEYTRIETLRLSEDGKQLNFGKKSVETKNETWETKGVYVKK
ncbi:MAG: hypothetical protein J7497_12075 [Chitinophagaceae bacterium]|nr:hypothetical protein [Chitinophagaceae bacterium]